MNAKQFKYVLTLADQGSFSKAAEILDISQPSLSQYVKKIEHQIGLPLFDRTNGAVRLTDAGRLYINTGRKVLDLERQLDEQLNDLKTYKQGSILIGTAPYRAAVMMPVISAEFQKKYPGMYLTIREGTTAELIEGMEHGEYDLCLTLLPSDRTGFVYEKVMEEELVLAVPANAASMDTVILKNRKYPAIDAKQINYQALIQLTDKQYMQKQLDALILAYQLNIKTAAVVKSLEAQIEMVKAGIGMALMPSGIKRFCLHQEVIFYSFIQELPKRDVVILWKKDKKLSKIAEELKNIIVDIEW